MPGKADRSESIRVHGPRAQRGHGADQRPGWSTWTALGVALASVGCAPPGPRAAPSSTDRMRLSTSVDAQGGTRLSYLQAGDPAGPRVVMVHGTPGAATGWTDYLLAPPPGTEVVALDRPGFGASGPDGALPRLAAQAAAVQALLPSGPRPVVLVGHSLGASVVAWAAAVLAVEQPERPLAVVLVAGSLDPALESIHGLQRIGAWGPIPRLLPRAIRNANAELMALKPELEALAPMLPAIRAKVVIVHGDRDDLVPVANVAYLEARLTGANCVRTMLLAGQNHFLPWNSEPVVREALRVALEPAC